MAVRRAQLPEGCVQQRRNCHVEHISMFRRSKNHPEHVFLHAHVDLTRLAAIYKVMRKHRAGVITGCPYLNLDQILDVGAFRLRHPYKNKLHLVGIRLYRDCARTQDLVQKLLPLAVYNKVGNVKREF